MTIIVGLSGKKRSGKNSVVHLTRILLDDYKDPPVKVRTVAFADPLKEMAHGMADDGTAATLGAKYVSLTHEDIEEKTDLGRSFLQDLGMSKRAVDSLYWVKLATRKAEEIALGTMLLCPLHSTLDAAPPDCPACRRLPPEGAPRVLFIPDVRFQNEADFVRSRGWLLWRVRRPIVEPMQAKDQHKSETDLDGYPRFDSFLVANDMQELFESVKRNLERLGLV